MATSKALRDEVIFLLQGGRAHVSFKKAVADLPEALQGKQPQGAPYSPWQQLEHLRIAQWDILEYIRNPKHVSPEFPDGYWPTAVPPAGAWEKAVRAFESDRRALVRMAANPKTDLLARVPADPKGPKILHELLLAADHNAYHLGQLIVLRRALGAWSD